VGGNVGYSWGHSDVTVSSFDVSELGVTGSESLRPRGAIAGLQAGYNWQASRNWVWGLETDFQWSGQKHSVTRTGDFSFPLDFEGGTGTVDGTGTVTVRSKLTWFGTARGRIGFVADSLPTVLWYGTGGLAYGRVKTSLTATAAGTFTDTEGGSCSGGCSFTAGTSFNHSITKLGWAAGAGAEGALGDKWTWKIEYLYMDLGTANGVVSATATACISSPGPGCTSASGNVTYSNKMTDNIVRVGLNYRWVP
jgi:outer membrane immunogenic protein